MNDLAGLMAGSALGLAGSMGRSSVPGSGGGGLHPFMWVVVVALVLPLARELLDVLRRWLATYVRALLFNRGRFRACLTLSCTPLSAFGVPTQHLSFYGVQYFLGKYVVGRPDVLELTADITLCRDSNATYREIAANPSLYPPGYFLKDNGRAHEIPYKNHRLRVLVRQQETQPDETKLARKSHSSTKTISIELQGPSLVVLNTFVLDCTAEFAEWKATNQPSSGHMYVSTPQREYADEHSEGSFWVRSLVRVHKTPQNCFYNAGFVERVLERLTDFRGGEQRYHAAGRPWKFTLLLHGLPGTGKTSLAYMLAHTLAMNMYVLDPEHRQFSTLLRDIPSGHMLLLDELDLLAGTQKRDGAAASCGGKSGGGSDDDDDDDENALRKAVLAAVGKSDSGGGDAFLKIQNNRRLRAMLSMLDGYSTLHGVVVVMITNHRDGLDPALVRECRVDLDLEMGAMDAYAMRAALAFHYGEGPESAALVAAVQDSWGGRIVSTHLLNSVIAPHKGDPEAALRVLRAEMSTAAVEGATTAAAAAEPT